VATTTTVPVKCHSVLSAFNKFTPMTVDTRKAILTKMRLLELLHSRTLKTGLQLFRSLKFILNLDAAGQLSVFLRGSSTCTEAYNIREPIRIYGKNDAHYNKHINTPISEWRKKVTAS
jgi:hypothetical protein